jgi:hypothetical protein
MRTVALVAPSVLGVAIALFACDPNEAALVGGAGSCSALAVFSQGAAAGNVCAQCLVNSCSSELQQYATGCADLITCVCTAGASSRVCPEKESEPSCSQASIPFGLCIIASCRTPCDWGPLDAGAGG